MLRKLTITMAMLALVLTSGTALALTLTGTEGDDTLYGTDQYDAIYGSLGGSDTIEGGLGDDHMYGDGYYVDPYFGDQIGDDQAPGSDTMRGGDGNDTINGGEGPDEIYGDSGNDYLYDSSTSADSARDFIYGGDGDDVIGTVNSPQSAEDVIYCGAGFDKAVVDTIDIVADDCEEVLRYPDYPEYTDDEDPSDFDSQPSFFCGYITGNPEDHCITDENGVHIAPDGTTFTVENGIVTFSNGRTLVIDRPSDADSSQYQPAPGLCAPPMEFGADYATLVGPPMPCSQSVQPYPLPPMNSI